LGAIFSFSPPKTAKPLHRSFPVKRLVNVFLQGSIKDLHHSAKNYVKSIPSPLLGVNIKCRFIEKSSQ
jgi:hypothetical protein